MDKIVRDKSAENIFNEVRLKYLITNIKDFIEYDIAMDIKTMLNEVRTGKKLTKNKIVVGTLDNDIIEFLKDRGVVIHTTEIYLTSKGLSHLARDSKKKRGAGLSDDDILRIPKILSNYNFVYFENIKGKLNLFYCENKCDSVLKIVVDTKAVANRKEKVTLVKTAGYVESYNIENDKNNIEVVKR